jgi:hypothetical protein
MAHKDFRLVQEKGKMQWIRAIVTPAITVRDDDTL